MSKSIEVSLEINLHPPISPEQRLILRRLVQANRRGRSLLEEPLLLDQSHWNDIAEHVEGIVATLARARASRYNAEPKEDQ